MIEIYWNSDKKIIVKNSENKKIEIDYSKNEVNIDWFIIDFPWEYEKSGILLEVKEYEEKFFYSFLVESKNILLILDENFELKEEIIGFFWDVDILLINWTKNSPKVIENIEARVIIPFWEWKDICLNALWQHKEEIENFKLKTNELNDAESQIINIKL
jgi:hypothetical protein